MCHWQVRKCLYKLDHACSYLPMGQSQLSLSIPAKLSSAHPCALVSLLMFCDFSKQNNLCMYSFALHRLQVLEYYLHSVVSEPSKHLAELCQMLQCFSPLQGYSTATLHCYTECNTDCFTANGCYSSCYTDCYNCYIVSGRL